MSSFVCLLSPFWWQNCDEADVKKKEVFLYSTYCSLFTYFSWLCVSVILWLHWMQKLNINSLLLSSLLLIVLSNVDFGMKVWKEISLDKMCWIEFHVHILQSENWPPPPQKKKVGGGVLWSFLPVGQDIMRATCTPHVQSCSSMTTEYKLILFMKTRQYKNIWNFVTLWRF